MTKMWPSLLLSLAFLLGPAGGVAAAAAEASPAERPASWAQAVQLDGVPNLHRVGPTLFRSAQPTAEGLRNLERLGIKTVVSLRAFHADEAAPGPGGLVLERIRVKTWHPEEEEVIRFLRLAMDPARQPILVHCQHGADRTGTMCAIYRVVVEGWTKEEAIREMKEGGYGFHKVWRNLPSWIEGLDVGKLRKEAGMGPAAAD